MIEIRDTPAGTRFLDLLWAEAQRQGIVAPPTTAPNKKKKREAVISRYAQSP